MTRWISVALCPPCAIVDCGCAAGCNAPIGVLYAAGVFALVYGLFFGGPMGVEGIGWGTVLLGAALWAISAAWAALITLRYGEQCATGVPTASGMETPEKSGSFEGTQRSDGS
jgi:hypothetical protein